MFFVNCTSSVAFFKVLFVIVILPAFSFTIPAIIALAAPPAPKINTSESLIVKFLLFIGSKKPSISVLYPLSTPSLFTTVFTAPHILHTSSISSKNFIISVL